MFEAAKEIADKIVSHFQLLNYNYLCLLCD